MIYTHFPEETERERERERELAKAKSVARHVSYFTK